MRGPLPPERRVASPPSTPITWPVTHDCAGSRSQAIAEATSSGSPTRPRACIAVEALSAVSLPVIRAVIGVRTRPGATAFTRRPFGA